jgi:hypothetical protein
MKARSRRVFADLIAATRHPGRRPLPGRGDGGAPRRGEVNNTRWRMSECDPKDLPRAVSRSAPELFLAMGLQRRQLSRAIHPNSHPNIWLPGHPAVSRNVSHPRTDQLGDQPNQHGVERISTKRDSSDLPRNAQVVGSSPTSGSRSAGQGTFSAHREAIRAVVPTAVPTNSGGSARMMKADRTHSDDEGEPS